MDDTMCESFQGAIHQVNVNNWWKFTSYFKLDNNAERDVVVGS